MDPRSQVTKPERTPAGEEVPPWQRPGAVRRDCEPHRGDVLRWMGRGSVTLGGLSVLPCTFLVGLPLGLTTWLLAGRDLARMRAGIMDITGEKETELARVDGLCGGLMCLVGGLFWGCAAWVVWGEHIWPFR